MGVREMCSQNARLSVLIIALQTAATVRGNFATDFFSHFWAHSMGPYRPPLSRVVVVVVVVVVDIDAQAACDRGGVRQ